MFTYTHTHTHTHTHSLQTQKILSGKESLCEVNKLLAQRIKVCVCVCVCVCGLERDEKCHSSSMHT